MYNDTRMEWGIIMSNIQYAGAFIALATNIIILVTQLVQVYKIKKELKDVKVVVNNSTDLIYALRKPLEGKMESAWNIF